MSGSSCSLADLGLDKNFHQLVQGRVRALVDLFQLDGADGVPHDQHRMLRRAESFLLGLRERVERMGNQSHREPAARLNLDRVVDTPRRARSSISQAAQDEIRLSRQLVEILLGRALLGG